MISLTPAPILQLALFIKHGLWICLLKIWSVFAMHWFYFLIHIENVLWQCNMYSRLFLLVVKSRLSLKTYGVLHICTSSAELKEASESKHNQMKSSYNAQPAIMQLGQNRETLEGKTKKSQQIKWPLLQCVLAHTWYLVSATIPLYTERFKSMWHRGAYVTSNNEMTEEKNMEKFKVFSLIQEYICKLKLQPSRQSEGGKEPQNCFLPCNITPISLDAEIKEDALCGIILHRPQGSF